VYLLNLNNIQPEELKFWTKDFVAMFLTPVKVFQQIKLLVIFMKTKMIKEIYIRFNFLHQELSEMRQDMLRILSSSQLFEFFTVDCQIFKNFIKI